MPCKIRSRKPRSTATETLDPRSTDDRTNRVIRLSPAKRALLELTLGQEIRRASPTHEIPRRGARESAPLSFPQLRLWFLNQLEPDNPSYNQPNAVRLRGRLDVCALQRALAYVVARHEVLRTTFASEDGSPLQLIGHSRPVDMPAEDLRHVSAETRVARPSAS